MHPMKNAFLSYLFLAGNLDQEWDFNMDIIQLLPTKKQAFHSISFPYIPNNESTNTFHEV